MQKYKAMNKFEGGQLHSGNIGGYTNEVNLH